MSFIFTNYIKTTVAATFSSSSTTLQLASSVGLPTLTAGQVLPIGLNDASTGLIYEIVYCTAITGANLTVLRAQEGTSAQNWSIGDVVFSGPTSGTVMPVGGNNVATSVGAATAATNSPQAVQIQNAALVTGTDTGAVNAYVIALTPAITAYTKNMTVNINGLLNTNTGASTLNAGGGALPIVTAGNAALTAGLLVSGYGAIVRMNASLTAWELVYSSGSGLGLTQSAADARYAGAMPNFTASTASSLISASLDVGKVDFRSAVLATGTPVEYNITSPLTLVMTSIAGSLGATTAVATSLIYAIVYDAGTPQLAVCNLSGGLQMDETNLITTTAIGAGSTAANVWYSTTAITTPSQYRIRGRVDATWTSGTGWSSPTLVQPVGVGEAFASLINSAKPVDVTASRAVSTTYYNTTGREKLVLLETSQAAGSVGRFNLVSPAGTVYIEQGSPNTNGQVLWGSIRVPSGFGYSLTASGSVTLVKWLEY